MSLDFHVHPWTKTFMKKNPPIMKAWAFFKLDVEKLPSSTEQLLEEMEEAGVAKSVILGQDSHATPNPNFKNYSMKNEEVSRIADKSGGKLVAFAGVDPNSPRDAVRELKHAVKDLGMKGLKVHSSASSVYPNDHKRMFPIYELCQDAKLPILFHTGTTGLGDCEIKYSKPEYLDEVCQRFPDLKVVMAHFGWPWSGVAIAIALRSPNVFMDISGWKPRYIPSEVLQYLNGILSDRFLFGTDYPMIRQKEWMDDFDKNLRPRLKPEVTEKLLHRNAERLLRD